MKERNEFIEQISRISNNYPDLFITIDKYLLYNIDFYHIIIYDRFSSRYYRFTTSMRTCHHKALYPLEIDNYINHARKFFNHNKKFMANKIGQWEPTFGYTIPDGPYAGKTLWSGRYVAVSCVILACETVDNNEHWFVLANKRGSGTPDDQGKWNMPCGYLNNGESATAACARETAEECGVYINSKLFKLINVETAPEKCNNGNVSLRHLCLLSKRADILNKLKGGEANEVDDVKWIPIEDIDKYEWAFNHKTTLLAEIVPILDKIYYHYHTNNLTVNYD